MLFRSDPSTSPGADAASPVASTNRDETIASRLLITSAKASLTRFARGPSESIGTPNTE